MKLNPDARKNALLMMTPCLNHATTNPPHTPPAPDLATTHQMRLARDSSSSNGSLGGRILGAVLAPFARTRDAAKKPAADQASATRGLAARAGLGLRVAVGWESRKGIDAPGHKGWSVASPERHSAWWGGSLATHTQNASILRMRFLARHGSKPPHHETDRYGPWPAGARSLPVHPRNPTP